MNFFCITTCVDCRVFWRILFFLTHILIPHFLAYRLCVIGHSNDPSHFRVSVWSHLLSLPTSVSAWGQIRLSLTLIVTVSFRSRKLGYYSGGHVVFVFDTTSDYIMKLTDSVCMCVRADCVRIHACGCIMVYLQYMGICTLLMCACVAHALPL